MPGVQEDGRRTIKLMWDYSCWPLWEPGGSLYALEPDSLPLSQSTKARLWNWAAIPDTKLAEVDYPPDIKWTLEEERAFEAEGHELWKILQRELGDSFRVTYYSSLDGETKFPED